MFDLIEKIRQKPEKAKNRIAFLTSFAFTVTILFFWIIAVYPSFEEQNAIDKKVRKLESGPTTSFSSIFDGKVSEIKERFSKLSGYVSSISTESDYYVASPVVATGTELMFTIPTGN